jgi:prophage regulatory protein
MQLLPTTGFVRLASILGPKGPIPVSKSTWWAGVKSGRYPKSVKLGPAILPMAISRAWLSLPL